MFSNEGVKYSADIVHSFIDALRNRRTKLRYLDITGLPIAEIIVKYVATHCRLAQKEYQRNCLIDEYLQNVNDLENLCGKADSVIASTSTSSSSLSLNPSQNVNTQTIENTASTNANNNNENENGTLENPLINNTSAPPSSSSSSSLITNAIQTTSNINSSTQLIRNDLKKTTSLPDEQLVFKFDCILQERATFEELMGALEANSINTRFILKISKLDLLCLGKSNIIKLLNKLDKEVRLSCVFLL